MDVPANDNDAVFVGSGNVFRDLDLEEAAKALDEFRAKGGRNWREFAAELELTRPTPDDPAA